MIRVMAAACMLMGVAGLAACEKAGENIDSAIETVADGHKDPADGGFEKAGEAVDNTLGIDRKNDADSIADAVDGDKGTTPN